MSCCFFNDTATTEIYTYLHTLSLHDALPIYQGRETESLELHPRRFRVVVGDIQIQDRAAGEEDRPCEVDLAPDSVGQLNRFLRQQREQHAIADQMAAAQRQREHSVNQGRVDFEDRQSVV